LKKKRKSFFPSGIHQGTEGLPKQTNKNKQTQEPQRQNKRGRAPPKKKTEKTKKEQQQQQQEGACILFTGFESHDVESCRTTTS
jgi:hypothetical protein